jgi:hypothetical protein
MLAVVLLRKSKILQSRNIYRDELRRSPHEDRECLQVVEEKVALSCR